jgi:hypothetical protein
VDRYVTYGVGSKIKEEIAKNGKKSIIGRNVDLISELEVDFSDSNRPFGKIEDIECDGYATVLCYDWLHREAFLLTMAESLIKYHKYL